jgi:ferredoxin-type protein NapH
VTIDKDGDRYGRWHVLLERRTWVQLASTVVLNSGVTQRFTKGIPCLALNCHACPVAATACPIGIIQHFVGVGQVPWYVFGVVGLAGAVGGRFACGWLCPFGWLQELVYRLPLPKWHLQPRVPARWWVLLIVSAAYAACGWLLSGWVVQHAVLFALYLVIGFVIYGILGVSRLFALCGIVFLVALATADTWFCKLCPAGVLEGGIPWVIWDPDLRELIGGMFVLKLALLLVFLAWMAVTQRPFCRWICPLGMLWSPLNRWSMLQMAVDGEACLRCDRCQRSCPVDIRIYEDPNAGACIRCMRCVAECPASCISLRVQ